MLQPSASYQSYIQDGERFCHAARKSPVDSQRVFAEVIAGCGSGWSSPAGSAWVAALEPGESLSSLVRMSVDREVERRRLERELEERRQAEIAANLWRESTSSSSRLSGERITAQIRRSTQ